MGIDLKDFNFFSNGIKVRLKLEKDIKLNELYKKTSETEVFTEVYDILDNKVSQGKVLKQRRLIWEEWDKYIEKHVQKIEVYEYENSFYVVDLLNDRVVGITKYSKVYDWQYYDENLKVKEIKFY